MGLEKVSCWPNEGTPEVMAGDPSEGDLVRVIGTQQYYRYMPPPLPSDPIERAPSPMELVLARLDAIEAKVDALAE